MVMPSTSRPVRYVPDAVEGRRRSVVLDGHKQPAGPGPVGRADRRDSVPVAEMNPGHRQGREGTVAASSEVVYVSPLVSGMAS